MTEPIASRTTCVLGDPDKPHTALPGMYVCDGHHRALYEHLRGIVDTVARIHIRAARSSSPTGGRSGGLKSQRSVLDLEALALAGPQAPGIVDNPDGWDGYDPASTVGAWARHVRALRGIAPTPPMLTADVTLLVQQLDWCCSQQWIDDMDAQLRAALRRAANADPQRVQPSDEGRCPALGDGPNGTCGGRLQRANGAVPWLTLPDRCERRALDVPAGAVTCQTCGATWATEVDEARLRAMRAEQAAEMLRPRTVDGLPMRTAVELAADCGVGVAAMRKRLQRDRVKPTGGRWYDPRVVESVPA